MNTKDHCCTCAGCSAVRNMNTERVLEINGAREYAKPIAPVVRWEASGRDPNFMVIEVDVVTGDHKVICFIHYNPEETASVRQIKAQHISDLFNKHRSQQS